MRDIGISPEDFTAESPVSGAAGLALEAIGRLCALRSQGAARVLDHLVDQLVSAARARDDSQMAVALSSMRSAHVADLAIINQYVPEAARRLGAAWDDDSLSFLEVTVGANRLAELVSEVGGGWRGDDAVSAGQASVLIVVPPGEQHTLGVVVLARIMRQRGISVCLRFAPSLTDLAALIATRRFDGAMVSVGSGDKIESCAVLVKTLNALSKGAVPVAVGGAILEMNVEDLAARTGAAVVTNNLETALSLFGVESRQKT